MFPRPDNEDDVDDLSAAPPPAPERRPYAMWLLLAANLALMLLAEAMGGSTNSDVLIALGAMEANRIAAGEYWRLFAAMFLHSGWMHLGLNCFGLFVFGQQVEQLYGHSRFVAIYALAGLAGSVTSYALNLSQASSTIGVGASGAVFGALGALVTFFLLHRDRMGRFGRQTLIGLLLLAAVNLAYGLAVQGVDNYAHMGGFAAGAALGLAFMPRYRPKYRPWYAPAPDVLSCPADVSDANSILKSWWALPLAGALLAGGVLWGNANVGDSPLTHLRQAQQYWAESNLTGALEELDRAVELSPDYGPGYLERARVMAELGNMDAAVEDAALALRLSATDGERNEALRLLVRLAAIR